MSVSRIVKQNCSASSQWTRVSTILPSLFQHSLLPSARYHGDERRIKERTDCREMKIFSNGEREKERGRERERGFLRDEISRLRAENERSRKSSRCRLYRFENSPITDDPRLLRGNKNWIKSVQSGEGTRERKGKGIDYPSSIRRLQFRFLVSYRRDTFTYTDHFASLRIAVTPPSPLSPIHLRKRRLREQNDTHCSGQE